MNRKPLMIIATSLLLLGLFVLAALAQENEPVPESHAAVPGAVLANVGTAFSYQGKLVDNGSPANGIYDLQFMLFDAATVGNQIGSILTLNNINMTEGLFTVTLDFGADVFNGQARWLEIRVKRNDAYVILTPRVALTPAPHALALPGLWTQQNGTSPNLIGGYAGNIMYPGVTGGVIAGGGDIGSANQIYDNYGTVGGGINNVAGINDGNPSNQYYATVSGGFSNTANGFSATVGGGDGNIASASRTTVGGGYSNTANANYTTVGGGMNNTASGDWGTVGGGAFSNASNSYATVGGGFNNSANGIAATVGGGDSNNASADRSTVSGGQSNFASYDYATVPGGYDNTAAGLYSLAAGRHARAIHDGAFVWADATNATFASTATNTFNVRASNGVVIYTFNNGNGLQVINNGADGVGLYAEGSGLGKFKATMRANNTETNGGIAAYLTNNSNFATMHAYNSGTGEVLYLQNGGSGDLGSGGGDFITAVNGPANDTQFRVESSGAVRSDVGYYTPAADFAEMLPAVAGLEPGDVLAIGVDGRLIQTTTAYQATVIGVYSTQPGFVGGAPVEGETVGKVPLAMVGVVPVKASAEGGAIQPGDLLTTSDTPGHAMKAKADAPLGTVIGKALEPLTDGTGVILMVVILQ